jgi:hypothetical protein
VEHFLCRRVLGMVELRHRRFVEFLGRPFLDGDGILGTFAQTGAQTITVGLAHQPGLAVDNLQRAFDTRWDTLATPVALLFVNLDNFAD